MKKFLLYLTVCVAIVATGCTDFGEENQLTFSDASPVEISNISSESTSITFTVTPKGDSGFFSWMIVAADEADASIQPDRVLKLTAGGLAKATNNFNVRRDTTVTITKLTPYTVYQIYAVNASKDGIVSAVKNASIRTKDDGGKPAPTKFAIADTTVTLTFHEPLQRGNGKVYVSYFAKNTLSGHKPLKIAAGFEAFNPQDIVLEESRLSVSGSELVIKLPKAPAGAYASITYDEGAVLDLEGNKASAYVNKADTLISGAPSRGITVAVADKTWKLRSEFADINPDTVATFEDWYEFSIAALPDSGVVIRKKMEEKPTVTFHESNKFTTINVDDWGISKNVLLFYLPEEPVRGATVDLFIPAGAVEDVYGNKNEKLTVEGNYLYSYGYTMADIIGTYEMRGINASTGAPIAPETVIIVADEESDDENAVIIKNMAKAITGVDSEVEAIFDPVSGALTVEDWQLLAKDWTHPNPAVGTADVFFATYSSPAIIFAVTSPGNIGPSNDIWGYYLARGTTNVGAVRWYDSSSVWVRTSTATTSAAIPTPFGVKEMPSLKIESMRKK